MIYLDMISLPVVVELELLLPVELDMELESDILNIMNQMMVMPIFEEHPARQERISLEWELDQEDFLLRVLTLVDTTVTMGMGEEDKVEWKS